LATVRIEDPNVPAPRTPVSQRVPFGGFSLKLDVANKDPNFYYYWQSDKGDNLERMLQAGYEFVTRQQAGRMRVPESLTNRDLTGGKESLDDRFCVFGGHDEHGRETKLYLMRQPMAFHEEDARRNAELADVIDNSIRRQTLGNTLAANEKYGRVDLSTRSEE